MTLDLHADDICTWERESLKYSALDQRWDCGCYFHRLQVGLAQP